MEPTELANCSMGKEFASVHNHDSSDFMNQDNEHFILKHTNENSPLCWDLLDEWWNISSKIKTKDQQKSGDHMAGIANHQRKTL